MTHLFFAPQYAEDNLRKEEGRRQRIRQAKAICDACPVKAQCKEWAYSIEDEHAILAGETATQRKKNLRQVGA
jgi:hypothetical protein